MRSLALHSQPANSFVIVACTGESRVLHVEKRCPQDFRQRCVQMRKLKSVEGGVNKEGRWQTVYPPVSQATLPTFRSVEREIIRLDVTEILRDSTGLQT